MIAKKVVAMSGEEYAKLRYKAGAYDVLVLKQTIEEAKKQALIEEVELSKLAKSIPASL